VLLNLVCHYFVEDFCINANFLKPRSIYWLPSTKCLVPPKNLWRLRAGWVWDILPVSSSETILVCLSSHDNVSQSFSLWFYGQGCVQVHSSQLVTEASLLLQCVAVFKLPWTSISFLRTGTLYMLATVPQAYMVPGPHKLYWFLQDGDFTL
jgi:hypothetical protein